MLNESHCVAFFEYTATFMSSTILFMNHSVQIFFLLPGGCFVTKSPFADRFMDWCGLGRPRDKLVTRPPGTVVPLGTSVVELSVV